MTRKVKISRPAHVIIRRSTTTKPSKARPLVRVLPPPPAEKA